MDARAIAVFDSGVGGLTVLAHLVRNFPQENFVYLGDTARLPYGDKSANTIRKYVIQNIRFLKTLKIKAAVVACNSASTVVLEDQELEGIPLLNVIDPGARRAVAATRNKKIGVIGTQATVRHAAYVQKLKELDSSLQIHQVACPLLVPLVEQNWLEDPITDLVLQRYLQPIADFGADTLILGCTHYPLLFSAIQRVLPQVQLIHSGEALAADLAQALSDGRIERGATPQRTLKILTTDLSPQMKTLAQSLLKDFAFTGPEQVEI